MATEPVRVGIVGVGKISDIYLQADRKFDIFKTVACTDLDYSRAQAQAAAYNIRAVPSVADLLADPEIELIINLTVPHAHAEVALAALEAGKSVYNEKPLTIDRADAARMLALAEEKDLRVGCAPDTFLGAGLQTCRALLDAGAIGTPVAATAFMLSHGPEAWHPNPNFFYQPGAGPLFDMGPYYITALVNCLGPVETVTGSARISFPQRVIGSEPFKGTVIHVNTPTHTAAVLQFASGAIATLVTSFDVWSHNMPNLEIYGSEGSLSLPDPNTFGGPVRLRRPGDNEWREIPLDHGYNKDTRGIGVADMAYAIRQGRPQRASGALAFHVLDVMHAVLDASREQRHIQLGSGVERPAALPVVWPGETGE
jgi:predicted dehydrogenase